MSEALEGKVPSRQGSRASLLHDSEDNDMLSDYESVEDFMREQFKDAQPHSSKATLAAVVCLGLVAVIVLLMAVATTQHQGYLIDSKLKGGACDVFCWGDLLEAIELSNIFNASKDFIDMPLTKSPAVILDIFRDLPDHNTDTLRKFLSTYFLPAGSDLAPTVPPDFQELPKFLQDIQDPTLREWGSEINGIWKVLAKRISPNVYEYPERHTLLPTKHPIIVVPGGRFREMYYWDTYWVVRGLLVSGMNTTAQNLVENLLDLVEDHEMVPNGGRRYYRTRSQPPLLALMVDEIYKSLVAMHSKKAAIMFLEMAVPRLRMEYKFWMKWNAHAVPVKAKNGRVYILNRFFADTSTPRPEMFEHDYEASKRVPMDDHHEYFSEVVSTAETGWDFSSRWAGDADSPTSMDTRSIIPVDLNDYLCRMEGTLSRFYDILSDEQHSVEFDNKQYERLEAMEALLWDEKSGQWLDYNIETKKFGAASVASNFVPLWGRCFDRRPGRFDPVRVVNAFRESGLLQPAGIATTLVNNTGQQWDFPNAWAPIQHIVIEGLTTSAVAGAEDLAFDIAKRWLQTNFLAYRRTGFMHEKYDSRRPGAVGAGGEYAPQCGFGWTNGVALSLLQRYGNRLQINQAALEECSKNNYFDCEIFE